MAKITFKMKLNPGAKAEITCLQAFEQVFQLD